MLTILTLMLYLNMVLHHKLSPSFRRAKPAFFNTLTSTMHNYHISAKNKYSILSKLMKRRKKYLIPPVIENDQVVTNSQQKADLINNFFASKLSVQNPQDSASNLPPRNDI